MPAIVSKVAFPAFKALTGQKHIDNFIFTAAEVSRTSELTDDVPHDRRPPHSENRHRPMLALNSSGGSDFDYRVTTLGDCAVYQATP